MPAKVQPRHSPFMEFVEKVSIAGLQEAFESHIRAVQYMFRVALIITFAAMGYETYAIIAQCLDQNGVLTTLNIIDNNPPFPGVTICYPDSLDKKYWDKMTTSTFENEKSVIDYMKKHNLHREDAVELLRRTLAKNVSLEDTQTATYRLIKSVVEKAWSKSLKDGDNLWSIAVIPCDLALQNCSMNGENFNCCQVARFMYKLPFGTCYNIPPNNLTNERQSHNSDRVQDNALLMNVSMDWSYGVFGDGVASDGFEIYIDVLPFFMKIPVFVPSGMDASVVMAEPKHLNQMSDCIPNSQAPKLEHFDHYDPQGVHCLQEAFIETMFKYFGCVTAAGSHTPEIAPCTFEAVFATFVGLTMSFGDDVSSALAKLEAKSYGQMTELGSRKSPCKPLCSRWDYPSLSASYAALVDHNGTQPQHRNASWSLIKIIMPYKSFMIEAEQKISRWSMAMRNVGSMMAVYAGFSAITLAEITFYGMKLILSKRRNVVASSVEPTVSLVCAIAKESAVATTSL